MQRERRCVDAVVDEAVDPHLALLLLAERSGGQDLVHDAGTLGAGEEGVGVVASQKSGKKEEFRD